jgi:ATP phosphoribosyltransferase
LKILIPKGRIYESVARLFFEAGYPLSLAERAYRPKIACDDIEAKIMKPQNVGDLLELGSHDAGFTGEDWIAESGADVECVLNLGLDTVKIVAAVPEARSTTQPTARPEDRGEKKIVVATEYVNIAQRWLSKNNYNYKILRTYGATEVFPPDDADMIIDNTSSGQTLKDNGLRIVETIMESSTMFVAGREAMRDPVKRGRINELAMLFKAVLEAREKVLLEMNVTEERFTELVNSLPSMRSPTISPLYGDGGFAIKIAVKKSEVPMLIPQLSKMGATDILEYDLRKVVP